MSTPLFQPNRQLLSCLIPLALAAGVVTQPAMASSHREAPFITTQPKVDGTDFYMFRSYEPGREGFVTLIANYLPLQDAYGGPNYFSLDDSALYEIHIDNNGDAKEDITFQFRFKNTLKDISLPINGKNVAIPLVQVGAISGINPGTQNLKETYGITMIKGDRRSGSKSTLTNANGGASEFIKPLDNIGEKTFGAGNAYATYANQFIYNVNIPNCGTGRVFVGQRKDPFNVALGRIFDLLDFNPIGPADGNKNQIDDKNITSLAMEVPIACLTTGGDTVIGGWTTASMRQGRLLNPTPAAGYSKTALQGGAWTQVSRLGIPLVNELVIGLKDKDRFNGSKPSDDGQFIDYVTNPTLPTIIQTLFPSAPAPTKFPRQDLVTAFLTGVPGLNQPKNVKGSEMLRLNTATPVVAKGAQKNLGVLANDAAGFPNGRRPGDDAADIELRVAMGVLCTLNNPTAFGCVAADAPAGSAPFTDGATVSDADFEGSFPYLKAPNPGTPD
ncbi:DUF4331 domain-containing protein [Ampullimonas aquatilis]|uniref:DUF4331 domain-containing protein n=1 Tax=Ampullimonas aquatilis TaxID=1341549 RepID=UPI003C7275CA